MPILAAALVRPPPPPLHAYLLAPPYTRYEWLYNVLELQPSCFRLGSMLALRVTSPEVDAAALRHWVPRLRARLPAVQLVLRVDHTTHPALLQLTRDAGVLRVRAVLGGPDPLPEALRGAITRPVDLGEDVEEWLLTAGCVARGPVAAAVRDIFRLAPEGGTLRQLRPRMAEAESTLRKHFQRYRLPAPGRWLRAARAVHAAMELQARPATPLVRAALDLGFADHSALIHLIRRTFDLAPREVRGVLGWEPLLARWLARHLPASRRELFVTAAL